MKMDAIDREMLNDIRNYMPPKHRNHGKHDMPLMPQDRVDRLQSQIRELNNKITLLDVVIMDLDDKCSDIANERNHLKKIVENVEKLPKTWRKYPDSDGWMESCALDVEVAIGVLRNCPLDDLLNHPRCINLFDGICKSPTGLCSSAKKHM